MKGFNTDNKPGNKKKSKLSTVLIIIAFLLVLVGISIILAVLKYCFALDKTPDKVYTQVSYETEIVDGTPIEKDKPEENINYEQPVDYPPVKIIDVPYINQRAKYPTGCESVSAVMALNFAGYDITTENFIDNYLPKAAAPYIDKAGKSLGYDPTKVFLGSPYSYGGWGCYFPVIARSINRIIDRQTHEVKNLYKTPLNELRTYIDNDIPVILWATQGMNKSKKSKTWSLLDGEGTFTWVSPNHCLLLVGYDDEGYYFNDPLTHKNCRYPADIVEKRYNALGKQAIAIVRIETEYE